MNNAAYITLANEMALRRQLDVIANNVANANTTGFKEGHLLFTQYLSELGSAPSQKVAFPLDLGIHRDFQDGPLTTTGNPLDMAIKGDAFFVVNTPAGPRYTRAGSFALNTQSQIVDPNGDQLLDDRGNPITVPPNQTQITISRDGSISTEAGPLAHIGLVRFDNPQLLHEESAGLYAPGNAQQSPASGATVIQGSIEGSNVQPIVEITRLMQMTHSYQDAQKLIDAENNRQKQLIQALTSQPQ
ncbi:MAG TPA: flagellar basal-body rod protein FlgF [Alphaproteobacteria bacterium]|nr:flagellar basal-body rod protein FlgF [Alphaproteobacteria bacterium]